MTKLRPRLLIVDDDSAQLHALCSTLKLEGFPNSGFTSAQLALATLRAQTFDLVLTDLKMPDMDGIEFLNAARNLDPDIIGIVMTGNASVDTAVAAMKAGALDYILKPFTLRMILPVLDRAFTIRQLRNENAELRNAEEVVRSLNTTLEHCVEERTKQLTDVNRELEAFAQSVSHDLRTPLIVINNFVQLLVEHSGTKFDQEAREYVSQVFGAAKRMEQLIDDLMRLSQVAGAELRYSDVDVSSMVASIIDDLHHREPERHVDALISAGVVCKADPQLLRIALENLLGNAWKFTSKVDSPHIEFGTYDGESATFFVRDNGAGFKMEYAKDLFTPFRRLHSSSEFPGSGVGLSIVQRIIRRHGGYVSAEGSEGHGATFYCTMPTSPPTSRIDHHH